MDLKFALDGASLFVRDYHVLTEHGTTVQMPDDLLVVDLASGAVSKTHDLPDPTMKAIVRKQDQIEAHGLGGRWRNMLAARSDGIVLVPLGPDANGWSGPTAIEILDPASGQIQLATQIRGDIHGIAVRG
jgi:hypothetical protein